MTYHNSDLPDARIDYVNHLHEQVQQMAVRTWQMAVVLGHTLREINVQCKHGEWGKLFKNSRSKSNAKLISHFNFGEKQAGNYMAVYDAAVEAAKRISEERAAAVMQMLATRPGQDFYQALGEISQASTIKEFLAEVVDDSESRGAKHSKANMRDAMEEAHNAPVVSEQDAQRDAANLVTMMGEFVEKLAPLCSRSFNKAIADQFRSYSKRLDAIGYKQA
ncbi:hypothetical protein [Akkermansia glycaniphila]|uniref:Uncharacterized protein n=1 Tax=Akkermansia glycaniphila TaxID=1679444 RepID=A0A1C7PFK9_9BACT|nr:hypothetical protein [Akkermansia glycaniphila]OCA02832.1 hypothetical protein AC781_08600 [Akkermansia glycaniphila]SEH76431.1 Hypothetical protein PYTT_0550 [Akkermansia glycaniphila]